MTALTATKKLNSKILQIVPCNLHADLSVRFFDIMRRRHFVYTFLRNTSQFINTLNAIKEGVHLFVFVPDIN